MNNTNMDKATNKVENQTMFTNVLSGGSNLKGNIKISKKKLWMKLAHNTQFKLLRGLKTK